MALPVHALARIDHLLAFLILPSPNTVYAWHMLVSIICYWTNVRLKAIG